MPALARADLGTATTPEMHAALPKQLGRFPFWQGEQYLTATLEEIYASASQRATGIYLNQAEPQPEERIAKEGRRTDPCEASRQEF